MNNQQFTPNKTNNNNLIEENNSYQIKLPENNIKNYNQYEETPNKNKSKNEKNILNIDNLNKFISQNKWSINDFEIGKKLGAGRFGKVYLVREKQNEFICALKVIHKSQIIKNNLQNQIRREIEIQSHFDHENILKFYDFFYDERKIYLVLEYAPGGELYKELIHSVKFYLEYLETWKIYRA